MKWAVVFFLCFSLSVHAEYFVGPVAGAMGGAGRAGAEAPEVQLLNPAVIPHAPSVDASLFYASGSLAQGQSQNNFGLSFVDNTHDSFMPGGLSVIRSRVNYPGLETTEQWYWQLSLASFVIDKLTFGSAVSFLRNGNNYPDQWNGTLGVLYTPTGFVGLAFVYENFAGTPSALPKELTLTRQVSAGLNLMFQDTFQWRLDWVYPTDLNPLKKSIYATGIETLLGEYLALRVGNRWSDVDGKAYLTAGMGFKGPKLKVDYAFQSTTRNGTGSLHSVDLRLAF